MNWSYPNEKGKFGLYGGRFVPDTLMAACSELESAYAKARKDKSLTEFSRLKRWRMLIAWNKQSLTRFTP